MFNVDGDSGNNKEWTLLNSDYHLISCELIISTMSGITKEIVTLQLGHYANFVGTHWWNIQESSFVYSSDQKINREVNPDVLFREGRTLQDEVTYTPRAIILDLKGSLNALKQDGVLYDLPDVRDDLQWMGDVTMHKEEAAPKNEFLRDLEDEMGTASEEQDGDKEKEGRELKPPAVEALPGVKKLYDLDEQVSVWTDYLSLHLHPRTIHIINDYTRNSSTEAFEVFGQGSRVMKTEAAAIEDKLHFFLEECDSMQGVHVMCDTHDGFSCVTASIVETLSDELSTKGLMSLPVHPCLYPQQETAEAVRHRLINTALVYERLLSDASSILPLSLSPNPLLHTPAARNVPHLKYKSDLAYHTSGILAVALENASLPYRVDNSPCLLSDITNALCVNGCKVLLPAFLANKCITTSRPFIKVLSLQAAVPFPLEKKVSLMDTLLQFGETLPWQSLSPMCSSEQSVMGQSVVLRGIPPSRLKGAPHEGVPRSLRQVDSVEELMSVYLQDICHTSRNAICQVRAPCKVGAPFPHLFEEHVSEHGEIGTSSRGENTGVDDIPVLTSIQTSQQGGQFIQEIYNRASNIKLRQNHRFIEEGLEEDSWKEVLENLLHQSNCYHD